MNYRNHFYFGVACWVGAAAYAGHAPHPVNIGAAGFAALLPDIDHPSSKLGRWFPAIGRSLTHRGVTHSFLALAVFAVWMLVLNKYFPQWQAVWMALLVGYASGIVGDVLTVGGVELFWPMRVRLRLPLLQKSGGVHERVFTAAMLVLAAYAWFSQRSLQEDLQLWLRDAGLLFHWIADTIIPLFFEGLRMISALLGSLFKSVFSSLFS